jgi:hypothetical protein
LDRSFLVSEIELSGVDLGVDGGEDGVHAWAGCEFGSDGVAGLGYAVGHGGCWSGICAAPVQRGVEVAKVNSACCHGIEVEKCIGAGITEGQDEISQFTLYVLLIRRAAVATA